MPHARCWPNKLPELGPEAWASVAGAVEAHAHELRTSLSQANTPVLNELAGADVYTGIGGLAVMFLHHFTKVERTSGSRYFTAPLGHCRDVLHAAVLAHTAHRANPSFLTGQPGLHALSAAAAHHAGDVNGRDNSVALLLSFAGSQVLADPATPDELLYGRAGFLYACAYVNKACQEPLIPAAVTAPIVAAVVAHGRAGAAAAASGGGAGGGPPLMYAWHGTRYLGAAHGLAGILHVLLMFPGCLTPADARAVTDSLDWLVGSARYASGNFASSVERLQQAAAAMPEDGGSSEGSSETSGDRLVHWCHGAPGLALTLANAYLATGAARYLAAARDACDVVWARGLLRRAGLCHGVAGNMYAFLALRRAEAAAVRRGDAQAAQGGADRALARARAFAAFLVVGMEGAAAAAAAHAAPPPNVSPTAASASTASPASASGGGSAHWRKLVAAGEMHGGDRAASLFEGAAGVAYALEDVLFPEAARFPGFEL